MVLSDSEVADLKLENSGDILVLMTLYKNNAAPQEGTLQAMNIYANLSAPILINTQSRIGMQKILLCKESKVDFRAVVNL